MFRPLLSFVVAFLFLASGNRANAELLLQSYSPSAHERFTGASFIGTGLNLSGISNSRASVFALNQWATMISPSYFLTATHNAPAIDKSFTFYETNLITGASTNRLVASGVQIAGSDLWLGKLNAPLPSSIATYAIATGNLLGRTIGVVGTSSQLNGQRLGRNVIDGTIPGLTGVAPRPSDVGDVYLFGFNAPGLGADEARVEIGDSGAPSFTLFNGEVLVTGIHWVQTTFRDPSTNIIIGTGSGDTQAGNYAAQIQAAMSSSGESARFVAVPEPTSLALCAAGSLVLIYRRRKRLASQR